MVEKNNNNLSVISDDSGFYRYLKEINNIPSLSQEEEFMLAKAYLELHDLGAAQKLVTSHLKLVAKIAVSYRNYGLPLVELVSEGNLGLMQAVKKYNPELGFRLSTYAMWWIKAAIQEYVLKSWSLVKIGTTAAQKKLFFSLNKIKNKLTNTYSRVVNEQDFPQIAHELNVSTTEVAEMNIRLSGGDISLNNCVNRDDGAAEMIDFIPETRPSAESMLIQREDSVYRKELLSRAFSVLNERELQILVARKLKDTPVTLEHLSIKYNISKERIRQIENKAFDKVQEYVLTAVNDKENMSCQFV